MADNDQNKNTGIVAPPAPQAPQTQRGPQGAPQAPQAQRREERPGGANPNEARGRDLAQQRREENERLRAERANRPQQVGEEGHTPTPTQEENDKIRNGEMDIDDKQEDGSGPDPLLGRNLRADALKSGYETR